MRNGKKVREFRVFEGDNLIGRAKRASGHPIDIVIDGDPYISKLHARIEAVATPLQGIYFMRWDNGAGGGSKNGTFVNFRDERIREKRPHPLKDGDRILIGRTTLTFSTIEEKIKT